MNVKENEVKENLELHKLQLQNFISTRQYATWKCLEKLQVSIKNWLNYKLYHLDGNRFQFEEYGLVCKYIRKEIRKIDHVGLANELANYVHIKQLIECGCISFSPGEELPIDLLNEIMLPRTTYARLTLNKQRKIFNHEAVQSEPDKMPVFLEVQHELSLFNARQQRIQTFESEYRRILDSINELGEPFKCEYGTLSILENKPQYDNTKALEELGIETFLNHIKVDMDIVTQLRRLGIIDNFIHRYVSVEDIRVDFIVQSLESEKKLNQYLDKKVELFKQRIG